MQIVEKNELEATALKEIGKLELVVTKVGKLGTAIMVTICSMKVKN